MVIVDRQIALLPVQPDDPRAGALEVRSPSIVTGPHTLFEQVWENGPPSVNKHHGTTPAAHPQKESSCKEQPPATPTRPQH
ncbi:hypothetical protein AB0O50_34770 [Streptomyces cyaneofuscatus]|uniref:hypothetical protein n=1 Tax=Streptomyces cyaneofuscatus TaxID=66883 RepID=UPI00342CD6DF